MIQIAAIALGLLILGQRNMKVSQNRELTSAGTRLVGISFLIAAVVPSVVPKEPWWLFLAIITVVIAIGIATALLKLSKPVH